MLRKIFLYPVLGLCLLTLSGCLTVGSQFPSSVSWIKPKTTTRKEIEKAFGPPYRTGYDSGLLTYSYGYYTYSTFGESQSKDLTVRFNASDMVESYSFSSSFAEDKDKVLK